MERESENEEEREREWGNGENISYIKTCLILSQNVNPVRTGGRGGHLQVPKFHKAGLSQTGSNTSPLELESRIFERLFQRPPRKAPFAK